MKKTETTDHNKNCQKLPQTPIKKIDQSKPVSESLIKRVQKEHVLYGPNGHRSLPKDKNTIPPYKLRKGEESGKYRHLSRSEALRTIKSDHLVLHKNEISPRDSDIEDFLKKIFNCTRYLITNLSSFSDFFSADCHDYHWLARRIRRVYGFSVCPGCIHEAAYIWRQIDIIKRYAQKQEAL